ncbi:LysR family transcriptional regulator [Paraburkholderia sp. EG286B]|uniref:LysR family transcriptional regulator n=1 Tax=Paraburkholderia sp. EG286B TaxID=3237011 RepID=UPI0034D2F23F
MSRENLADLSAFVTVARERSFTRAAAQLGLSRSALSHAMSGLEARLGVRLLTRTTRSVSTTEAGARLLATLEPRLAEIDAELEELSQFRETPAGLVRISATDYAINSMLWPKLVPLMRRFPDVQIELHVDYGLTDIVAERFDAGVRAGDQIAKDMIAVLIAPKMTLAVVGSPEYLADRQRPLVPDDLLQHRCINLRVPTSGGLFPWELQKNGQTVSVRVNGPAIFNTVLLVLQGAVDGLGLALLPLDLAQPQLDSGGLVPLLEDWWQTFPCYLYYPSRRHASSAFTAVVDALRYGGS